MFVLYNSGEYLCKSCGVAVLDDIVIESTEEQGINSLWFCNITIFKDELGKYSKIKEEMIISIPTLFGQQPFRIKEIDSNFKSTIEVYCTHVFFDLQNRYIERYKVQSESAMSVMINLPSKMDILPKHSLSSDIEKTASFDWWDKNVVDILIGDDENSFVNKYGGELYIDKWSGSMLTQLGEDNGVQFVYKKNISEFYGNISMQDMITKIKPIGYNGLRIDGYVRSQYIANYNDEYTRKIEFLDIKVKEGDGEGYATEEEAKAALRTAAANYFITTKCDIPSTTFTMKSVATEECEEYLNSTKLEKVLLGDTVNIYLYDLGINTKQRMIKYKYNSITQKYIEQTYSNTYIKRPSLMSQINAILNK